MVAGVFVSHQLHCPGVEVLLGIAHALLESGWHGLVKNFNAGTWAFVNLDTVQSRMLFTVAR